ncbi:translation elongation factor 4 [Candidatus Saccharibacteria bacterium]|nr:translation elongation factor 4 [Candidatus Saccharibacteria bacterium]MBP9131594.1 translation elongation factor 4 [Candidatus Saccharibacteria bacterium]
MKTSDIRNLCIIAHIDHGKSTLADRLLEMTGTVQKRDMRAQMLDGMDLEREKGITIKLTPVRMRYKGYTLNLIDTPGHVDFSYEVSRSLAAVEGALLVVDASQGIQAQTLANVYLAMEHDLKIIPVLNKIDLPAADPDRVASEVMNLLGCERSEIIEVSAKTGKNVDQILDAIIEQIPEPKLTQTTQTRALVFDSFYDEYRGVVLYLRVFDGELPSRSNIRMMATDVAGEALEVGALIPKENKLDSLERGQIGYVVTNLKSVAEARVGDTLTLEKDAATEPLAGYQEVKPFVYAGLYPSSADEYPQLKDALSKLKLSDAALVWENESSAVLGNGFRVGFLGLLHMEIVKERLERDNNIELIITNPSTDYEIELTSGEDLQLKSAGDLPDPTQISEIREPWIKGEIVVPKEYLGKVLELIVGARGLQDNISYLDDAIALITFQAPLANMLTDFYDNLKSSTSGYGSFNYELSGYKAEDLVKLDLLVAGEVVDSLSQMVHRSEAQSRGREYVSKMKDVIPRQLFEIAVQAAIGGKIIAREDIKAMGKNVTGHLYGGDVSRKKKLWAKQKKGKQRMKKFGKVEIPPEAFSALLRRD